MNNDEMLALLADYDRAPDDWRYCDALCVVADELGVEGEVSSSDLRSVILREDGAS